MSEAVLHEEVPLAAVAVRAAEEAGSVVVAEADEFSPLDLGF